MDPVLSHILAAAGGALIGGLLCWLLMRNSRAPAADAEKKLDEYRTQVAEHFARTSALVDSMTDSYKAVFDELSEGAHKLMEPEQLKNLLANQSEEVITLSRLSYRTTPESGKASKPAPAKSSAPAPKPEPAPPKQPKPD